MRIVIKKSVQSVDPEWLITILRIMKMKKLVGGIVNPWNAFQSAFAEQPFEVYAMTRRQVSMFYHTTKDHLARHVEALSVRPTGSLWDYVPEPRLHAAQPQANDAHAMNAGADDPADEGYFTADEGDNADGVFRCLGCEKFMHQDEAYSCMECQATPFHIECLELHYDREHPRAQLPDKEKAQAEEEAILQQEAEEASAQWVDQMANLSKIVMPFNRKLASAVIALVSVGLAFEPFWSPTAADAPALLQ